MDALRYFMMSRPSGYAVEIKPLEGTMEWFLQSLDAKRVRKDVIGNEGFN